MKTLSFLAATLVIACGGVDAATPFASRPSPTSIEPADSGPTERPDRRLLAATGGDGNEPDANVPVGSGGSVQVQVDAGPRGVGGTTSTGGATSMGGTVTTGCTKDVDCKGDRICVGGECVDPVPTGTGGYVQSMGGKTNTGGTVTTGGAPATGGNVSTGGRNTGGFSPFNGGATGTGGVPVPYCEATYGGLRGYTFCVDDGVVCSFVYSERVSCESVCQAQGFTCVTAQTSASGCNGSFISCLMVSPTTADTRCTCSR